MKKLQFLMGLLIAILAPTMALQAYTVVSGDSMWKIAQNAGIGLQELIGNNPQVENPDLIYPGQEINLGGQLGATLPIAGNTYNLAGSGVTGSATSLTLQSFTIKQIGQKIQDSDLSDTFYITLEPGNNKKQEIASCTTVTQNSGGTATLSGCSRGLSPIYPYTASTTLQFPHAGGSQVIFSDAPQLFNEYGRLQNNNSWSGINTSTGQWIFSNPPGFPSASTTVLATLGNQFISKYHAETLVAGGFSSLNIGTGKTLRANGTSPETLDVNTSTASNISFIIENSKFEVATGTGSRVANTLVDLKAGTNTWTDTNTFNGTTTLATTTLTLLSIGGTSTATILNGSDATTYHWHTQEIEFVSSSNLRFSADAEQSNYGQSYTKVKEIQLKKAGTIIVSFDVKGSGVAGAKGRIYLNGVANGAIKDNNTTSYITYGNQATVLTGVVGGDLVQLYLANGASDQTTYARNFRIYYDLNVVPNGVVITD